MSKSKDQMRVEGRQILRAMRNYEPLVGNRSDPQTKLTEA